MKLLMVMVVIKADGRMLLGRAEALFYSFSIEKSQASPLQATLAPDTNHGMGLSCIYVFGGAQMPGGMYYTFYGGVTMWWGRRIRVR